MSLRAWAGFIAVSLACMMFYAGLLPAWNIIYDLAPTFGVSVDYMIMLNKVLYWAPFVALIAALIHAVTSPSYRRRETWR